ALFHIERSKNANIVMYDAVAIGPERLDPRGPVAVYWIMKAEKGQRESLSKLEQRFYGFRLSVEHEGTSYLMVLRAAPDRSIRITPFGGRFIAQTVLRGRSAILDRIYVESEEGLFLPKVRYVDLFGADISSAE